MRLRLGNARVSRVGERVLAIANFPFDCCLPLLINSAEDSLGPTPEAHRCGDRPPDEDLIRFIRVIRG
jgi:hypothetical protein